MKVKLPIEIKPWREALIRCLAYGLMQKLHQQGSNGSNAGNNCNCKTKAFNKRAPAVPAGSDIMLAAQRDADAFLFKHYHPIGFKLFHCIVQIRKIGSRIYHFIRYIIGIFKKPKRRIHKKQIQMPTAIKNAPEYHIVFTKKVKL